MADRQWAKTSAWSALAAGAGVGYFILRNRASQDFPGRLRGFKTARDIMTPDPKYCLKDTPIVEVARLMVEFDCGEIPVVDSSESQRPIGVVTDRDIVARLVAQGINPLDMHAETCMSVPVVTTRAESSLDECIRLMEHNRIRRVPVVDDQGRLCGMVSQADIARFTSKRKAAEVLERISEPLETSSNVAA